MAAGKLPAALLLVALLASSPARAIVAGAAANDSASEPPAAEDQLQQLPSSHRSASAFPASGGYGAYGSGGLEHGGSFVSGPGIGVSYGGAGLVGGSYGSYGVEGGGSVHGGFDHQPLPLPHPHVPSHHPHYPASVLKGLLIPLAGAALLGAAAALAANPVLLQIGVISGRRRRRRRDAAAGAEAQRRLQQLRLLEDFLASVGPQERAERSLLASYLSCSGQRESSCLQRLVCEMQRPDAPELDRRVMDVIKEEIFSNELVPDAVKKRITQASDVGLTAGKCEQFPCSEVQR
ncbi:uncharacterized protein LOC124606372 [Schistocerca americana]|uniref:uncharacterized protein LOC124606372 n=1 Tax=Schistocerca americana TaxID=7009 RepID=UPI001F4F2BC3|nr:uncharacterized protein LOC124606372 [Schistocerca americana]